MANHSRLQLLRVLLAIDAAVLVVFGGLFLAMPGKVLLAFGFREMPPVVGYLIGLWGCAFVSLGLGYGLAVENPLKNIAWVRVGIVRGALECAFGLVVIARHLVTWQQAGFGTLLAGAMTVAYLLTYPVEAV
jgi:hypothetical protein